MTLAAGTPREFVLEGLQPDTGYFYRWVSRNSTDGEYAASQEYRFHTARARGQTYSFTVQADPHLDTHTDPRLYEASLKNAAAGEPDFHVDLGDTFMTDKRRADYREALPQYLAQRYYFGLIGSSVPLFLVSGNHDGEGRSRGAMGEWAREQRRKYFATPSDDHTDEGNYYAWT